MIGAEVPFLIGVTGHRNLVEAERAGLESRIAALFDALARRVPTAGLRLLCSLAEGADTLVANMALARGIALTAVLPLPADDYRSDFESEAARADFDRLLTAADTVVVAPPVLDDRGRRVPSRELAYVAAGEIIAAASRLLIAIWDGRDSPQLGGTAHVVDLRRHPRRNGVDRARDLSGLLIGGDDPIYQLVASRAPAAGVSAGLAALDERWIVGDTVETAPATRLPESILTTLERLEAFALDRRRHAGQIAASTPSELPEPDAAADPAGAATRSMFHSADMLGRVFKHRLTRTLVAIYAFAVASGVLFMLYGNFALDWPIYVVLLMFALAWFAHRRGAQGDWHRRFLQYRLLAETLRVRYFWHLVGVHRFGAATPHEGFSFELAGGLGWVRNAASYVTLLSMAQDPGDLGQGADLAAIHWIGDTRRGGQLQYFASAWRAHRAFDERTSRIATAGLAGGLICALLLGVAKPLGLPSGLQPWVLSLMGLLPLIAGVREAYALKQADKEMIKQFGYMQVIFERARTRLAAATDIEEKRDVLRELGGISLRETAEWLLVQSPRALDRPKI